MSEAHCACVHPEVTDCLDECQCYCHSEEDEEENEG